MLRTTSLLQQRALILIKAQPTIRGFGTTSLKLNKPTTSTTKTNHILIANHPEKPYVRPETSMTWTEYFQYKKQRQLRDKILSFPSAFLACGATGSYLMTTVELDPANNMMIYGFDPMLIFLGASALAGFVSFLTMPLVGSLIYRIIRPKVYKQMIQKDADFYQRISKYRVNMAVQPRSVAAPPDYYGERILSIKDYRHWLRRQFDYKRQMGI